MEPFEKKIQEYTENVQKNCIKESSILETIQSSEDAFIKQEDRLMTYAEFLYQQLRYIGKRWWILQGLVLAILLYLLNDSEGIYAQRTLGAGASLFVILVIPELWKNRRTSSMEIEGTSFYSLRQIYSARILLLGMADLLLLTLFYIAAIWDVTAFSGDVYHQLCCSIQHFLLHLLPDPVQQKGGDGIPGRDHLPGVGSSLDDDTGAGPGL